MAKTNKNQKLCPLIIAGTVKGGTTSLFEYLKTSHQISPSRIKETCFFLPIRYGGNIQPVENYWDFFQNKATAIYALEATPGYLDGGLKVASCVYDQLGEDVRIIFSLRNPADRLVSFFRYKKAMLELPKDMSFSQYLDECISKSLVERMERKNDAYWGIDGGRYINFLPGWYDVFGDERIKVVFFDDLEKRPQTVMLELAHWLKIDSSPFLNMKYSVENKTVNYRIGHLHRLAIKFNYHYEEFFRKHRRIKKIIREIYFKVNGVEDQFKILENDFKIIDKLYKEDNKNLSKFLKKIGYVELPSWLQG